ncbi:hypothetical protein H9626_13510 [Phocaeicola sp. Sa1YUN3]|uniref:Uncharacterized protein n=1 Tax=Phocaeicola faecium TaxID=2762213 RepID=A0ABR8VF26_9BACT|nr:hypothetical protein [Phocaeicola faecium]
MNPHMHRPCKSSIAEEVRDSLKKGSHIAALALALTIPDAYGKLEYPKDGSGERYRKWYRQYCAFCISAQTDSKPTMLGFDEHTCYKLRCELLHAGDADLKPKELNGFVGEEHSGKDVSFTLRVGMGSGTGATWPKDKPNEAEYHLAINIEELCNALCDAADQYERQHPLASQEFPRYEMDDLRQSVVFHFSEH